MSNRPVSRGPAGKQVALKVSQAWGGLAKHRPLLDAILQWTPPTSPKWDSVLPATVPAGASPSRFDPSATTFLPRNFGVRVKHFPRRNAKNPPTARIYNGEIQTKLPERLTRGFRNTFNPRGSHPSRYTIRNQFGYFQKMVGLVRFELGINFSLTAHLQLLAKYGKTLAYRNTYTGFRQADGAFGFPAFRTGIEEKSSL